MDMRLIEELMPLLNFFDSLSADGQLLISVFVLGFFAYGAWKVFKAIN